MAELALRVNGLEYAGWQSVRVTRSIEALSGSFEVALADRWTGQNEPWPIYEEDSCSVVVGDETLITGYVDRRSVAISAEQRSLSISGRDRAAALIDCSADLSTWEFFQLSLGDLASQLVKPFGIAVSIAPGLAEVSVPMFEGKFSISPGERAFEVLERACRAVGVLAVSNGRGGVHLTRAGSARAASALVEGQNILAASADFDASGKFRTYKVTTQQPGTDELYGSTASSVIATAQDLTVRRAARELLVRGEAAMPQQLAEKRARWEAKVRAARAATVSVTVAGWTQADGKLWPVNALVPLDCKSLGIKARLLITQVAYSLDERGKTTQLSLKRPDAFLPEPNVNNPDGTWPVLYRAVK